MIYGMMSRNDTNGDGAIDKDEMGALSASFGWVAKPGTVMFSPMRRPVTWLKSSNPLPLVFMNYLRATGLFVAEAEDYSYIPDDMGWGKGRRTVMNVA